MVNNNVDRAKQFLAFEALKGLDEALKEKEKESVNKRLFFKDEQASIIFITLSIVTYIIENINSKSYC